MISFFNNATTASPSFVSCALNLDGTLEAKTRYAVLHRGPGGGHMGVVRESSSAPGLWSLDVYRQAGVGWEFMGEHPEKLRTLPHPPAGAFIHSEGRTRYWTRTPMSGGERDFLRDLERQPRSRAASRKRK